jgi:flagella basal body P-ring formation protein FlgA
VPKAAAALLLFALTVPGLIAAQAANPANPAAWPIPEELLAFAQQHPALEGRRSEVRWAQRPISLPPCQAPTRLRWLSQTPPPGRMSLEVSCNAGRPWQRQLMLEVQVWTDYWVAKRSLPAGHRLAQEDMQPMQGLSGRLPQDLAGAPDDWAGQELARNLGPGSALRLNNLRIRTVIRRGMEIQVKILGKGFEIMSSGVALSDAGAGSAFQVKIGDGKTLRALAVGDGLAEVRMD